MKKILSIVAIGALFTSYGFATDNQSSVTATVEDAAEVGFTDQSGIALTTNTLKFTGGDIALGTLSLSGTTDTTKTVFVKTNSIDGVKMTISDTTNSGHLDHTTSTDALDKIDTAYKYGVAGSEALVALGTPFNLTSAKNAGSATVGNFIVLPRPTATQLGGSYSTTLVVAIAAN
jgi:hypothetical protein